MFPTNDKLLLFNFEERNTCRSGRKNVRLECVRLTLVAAFGLLFLDSCIADGAICTRETPAGTAIGKGDTQDSAQNHPLQQSEVASYLRRAYVYPDPADLGVYFEYSTDGTKLIAASVGGGDVVVWDVASGDVLTRIPVARRSFESNAPFQVAPDGSTIYVVDDMETELVPVNGVVNERGEPYRTHEVRHSFVGAWDARTGELKLKYKHDPPREIADLMLLLDGQRFVTRDHVYDSRDLHPEIHSSLWDVELGLRELPEDVDLAHVTAPEDNLIAYRWTTKIGRNLREILVFDPETLDVKISLLDAERWIVRCFSPDGKLMIGIGGTRNRRREFQEELIWWEAQTGREIERTALVESSAGLFGTPTFSRGSQWLAVSNFSFLDRSDKLLLYICDTSNHSVRHIVELGRTTAKTQLFAHNKVFSPDGMLMLVCVERCTFLPMNANDAEPPFHSEYDICLIDVATGKILATRKAPQGAVGNAAFSPDGKTLAIAFGRKVLMWNWEKLVSDFTED